MTGQYETYILVKVKDGRKFVCGMNLPAKTDKPFSQLTQEEQKQFLDRRCVWN